MGRVPVKEDLAPVCHTWEDSTMDRGVTRPMAMDVDSDDRQAMLEAHHRKTLWIPWTLILLGAWLVLAPHAFGYGNPQIWVHPSGGRGVWFSTETHDALRASLMTWSDIVSGVLLLVLGWRTLKPDRPVGMWSACFVGLWLLFAPIAFWAPTAGAFLNDSIVGLLVIALTILIPGMPNMPKYMVMGDDTPPGWSYNPSSWPQRWILIVLGFLGLVVSRALASYQLGYVDWVWDPFFGFAGSTQAVLDSDMSHMWPISDAGLGTVAYSLEFLMGYMGGTSRWRTMPWMVTIFGILVIPLGLTHIALVMSQPVVVHTWCTLCLVAAGLMLPMIPLEVDEVVAMAQHVRDSARRGDRAGSVWRVFWMGGSAEGCTPDERSPALAALPERPGPVVRASIWGFSTPVGLIVSTLVGIWLLFAPSLLGVRITTAAADVAHIGGAAAVVVSVTAMGEVLRSLRFANVLVAATVVIGALLTGGSILYSTSLVIAGIALAVLSIPRGHIRESYGTWDAAIR